MPKTRSKRAAETTEPVPAEPARKRQSKRVKKEPTPKPEPAPVEGPAVAERTPELDEQVLKEEPRASDLYLDTVSK